MEARRENRKRGLLDLENSVLLLQRQSVKERKGRKSLSVGEGTIIQMQPQRVHKLTVQSSIIQYMFATCRFLCFPLQTLVFPHGSI